MVNAGSVASPPTTVAPGIAARAVAVDGDHVDAVGDELLDDVAADLAGAEDDVPAHDWFSLRAAVVEGDGEDEGERGDGEGAAGAEDGELLVDVDADQRW